LAELAAQEIPAGTLDDVGVLGAGVRVMTAHRSKGLQWEVVVVAGVQADAWPDLRRRGSVIDSDLLGSDGLRVPSTIADLRRDERRLFYVAITRARRRVVCTAVQAPADDGARPSPFLQDLEIEPVYETDTVRHPLTLSGVVAGLRRELADDGATPAFRRELATRLAALGTPGADGKPVISAADPEQWWGLREATGATTVALDGNQPLELHLSGSQIEMLQRCPLQWYLTRRVKAETSRGTAAGFGGVLHALADAVARKELPAEVDALARALDDIWSQLPYTAAWEAGQEHDAAVAAIERFLEWHSRARDRELVATEAAFEQTFTIFDVSVRLSGRVDRLERDGDGLVVVDFKTSRSQRASKDVASDLQLATYRRLVAAQYDTSPSKVAAELVQLRVPERKNAPGPKVQEHDPSAETDEALQRALERAVTLVSKGEFPAVPNKACSYCQFSLTCPAQPAGREVVS
ncbi:MAG: PD-(D/E)XK nuclease family protein, partial [Actinomycetes bacterium]